MSKRLLVVVLGVFFVLGMFGCASQSGNSSDGIPSGDISVCAREDGSGTRGAFTELFGVEEKRGDEKVDMTTLSASITNSTAVMITTVTSDPNAIGYLSLGSLNDTVKPIKIDGSQPSADNVKNGTYKIARPFNILTKNKLSSLAADFQTFIMSADGQKIVEDNGCIAVDDAAKPYEASHQSGKVAVAGSSSVTPVMEKLAEAYEALNEEASVEVQQSDSTTGIQMIEQGTCDIGMASRDLKDSEVSAGVKATAIAIDGIAVIVNKYSQLDNLSSDQVKAIYTGKAATWEEVLEG